MNDTNRPPSVHALATSLADTGLPHPLLVDAARQAIAAGDPESARSIAERIEVSLLRRVINATGTLLHTNLGRAPLAVEEPAGYRNIELDLATGERGSRQSQAPTLLARACGAEAALAVNNCASAVMLVLAALAPGRDVAVSRGELVEIGGGFRIPEVLEQSGARLLEVGTTNRTRTDDYRRRMADPATDVAMILQVHQSNYKISGFTEMPTTAQLAALDVPLVADIGSGLLDAACPWLPEGPPRWLAEEPAARQTLEDGASLVVFSGDKLLGGPQAGIIAGDAELVARCGSHPLARALRPGGLVLGALQRTALAYLARDGQAIPFWRMATTPVDELRGRAEALGVGRIIETASVPGGGTLPTVEIPSVGVAVAGDRRAELRGAPVPIVARVEDDATICDLRTVDPTDDVLLGRALEALAA